LTISGIPPQIKFNARRNNGLWNEAECIRKGHGSLRFEQA